MNAQSCTLVNPNYNLIQHAQSSRKNWDIIINTLFHKMFAVQPTWMDGVIFSKFQLNSTLIQNNTTEMQAVGMAEIKDGLFNKNLFYFEIILYLGLKINFFVKCELLSVPVKPIVKFYRKSSKYLLESILKASAKRLTQSTTALTWSRPKWMGN